MLKQIVTCDHCGKECDGKLHITLYNPFARASCEYINDDIHGCSKEHTILALAKILGIGVDGKAVELLEAKDARIAKLSIVNDGYRQRIDELQHLLTAAQYDADSTREELSRLQHEKEHER